MGKINLRKNTTIGNVGVRYLQDPSSKEYSDGDIEDELLLLASRADFEQKRKEILANDPSWPLYYHLSPLRGNLVNWYSFDKNSRILEIGAGAGAITEALAEVAPTSTIDALELSERRALINANRNKSHENLSVIIGNLDDFEPTEKYDYVICIGVLEYAGRYISGDKPFHAFLATINKLLREGGVLLLAIENAMGIKYLNGAREDHTGRYFDSTMSYPQYDGVRTFSKKELLQLMDEAGLQHVNTFLPIPDYKHPRTVINEGACEYINIRPIVTKLAPAPVADNGRSFAFSEQLATQQIINAGLFTELANSFIVEVKKT